MGCGLTSKCSAVPTATPNTVVERKSADARAWRLNNVAVVRQRSRTSSRFNLNGAFGAFCIGGTKYTVRTPLSSSGGCGATHLSDMGGGGKVLSHVSHYCILKARGDRTKSTHCQLRIPFYFPVPSSSSEFSGHLFDEFGAAPPEPRVVTAATCENAGWEGFGGTVQWLSSASRSVGWGGRVPAQQS